MKKVLVLLVLVLTGLTVNAQKFSGLDKSPMDAVSYPLSHRSSDKIMKVVYSRPQLKNRAVEKLAPAGKVWRTGANEATEITFFKDVVFGGKKVKEGTYSLFTIPGEKEWTVILSKDLNVWGSYSYNKNNDVVRVTANVSENDKSIEAFSITFDDSMNLYMGWGTTLVTLPISE